MRAARQEDGRIRLTDSWEHDDVRHEGEIERLAAIGRNMSAAPRWARLTAKVVVLSMLAVSAVGLVQSLVDMLA